MVRKLKADKAPKAEIDAAVAKLKELKAAVGGPAPAPKEKKEKKPKGAEEDKLANGVLRLPAEMAAYKVVVLPVDMRVVASPGYATLLAETRARLTAAGLQYKVDESGASIGRRYARADELGIPYAVTLDFDTVGMPGTAPERLGIATLRERDSTDQVFLPLADCVDAVQKLCSAHPLSWGELYAAKGPAAAGGAAGGAVDSSAMLEYLSQHGVTAKLNAAVNQLAKERPADPMAFLANLLTK